MIGDKTKLSLDALQQLLSLDVTVQDLEELMKRKWKNKLDESRIVTRIPAKEAFHVFLANASTSNYRRRGMNASSIAEYERILLKFYSYCVECGGTEIEVKDIPQYALTFLVARSQKANFAAATWNKYAAVLRSFLWELSDRYDVKRGHFPGFLPLREKLPQALSQSDVEHLIRIAKESQYALRSLFMITFFLGTGVRRDEFRLLRYKDIRLSQCEVHINGKGGKRRIVVLPEDLVPLTETYFQVYKISKPMDYVYSQIGHPDRPVSASTIDTNARRLFEKIPTYIKGDQEHGFHLHSLRHTYATHLVLADVPMRAVAEALGHASVNTTMVYTKLNVQQLREQLRPGHHAMERWWRGFNEIT